MYLTVNFDKTARYSTLLNPYSLSYWKGGFMVFKREFTSERLFEFIIIDIIKLRHFNYVGKYPYPDISDDHAWDTIESFTISEERI